MKRGNVFYLIFILTILAMRLAVFLFPQRKLIIGGVIVHHFWIGAILILLVLLLTKRYNKLRTTFFAIGLGLVTDELIYIAIGDGAVSEYWSTHSVSGAIMTATIIFAIRGWLTRKVI